VDGTVAIVSKLGLDVGIMENWTFIFTIFNYIYFRLIILSLQRVH
jgi:hypothetical protein